MIRGPRWLLVMTLAAGCVRGMWPVAPPDSALDRSVQDGASGRLERGNPDRLPPGTNCVINAVTFPAGATKPGDSCRRCDPGYSAATWSAAPGCVVTLAGTGTAGFADGPAASAQFNAPKGIAVDAEERIYVADTMNHRLRVVFDGVVSTLAGSAAGFADGPATTVALFQQPTGVKVDLAGKVYVADSDNHCLRLIDQGSVSTFAGGPVAGYADGPAINGAQFNKPRNLALGPGGVVYVADSLNHCIRRVAAGQVTTIAGNGTSGMANGAGADARFNTPTAVATSSAGPAGAELVYVADTYNQLIRMIQIAPSPTVTTAAGNGTAAAIDGPALSASFSYPHGIALDPSGGLLIAEETGNRIRRLAQGSVETLAGNSTRALVDGPVATASFDFPNDVAVDGQGRIFVADQVNHAVRMIVP